jgi:hypothetical protein
MRLGHAALPVLFTLLSGCGKYAEFSLPPLAGGDPGLTFALDPDPDPVLPRDNASDVLNPSVAGRSMFYSEFDGRTWHTAEATSDDGLHWVKRARVLSPDPRTWEGSYIAANGSAWSGGTEIWYWYQAGPRGAPRIGLAVNWRKRPEPVLEPGPYMSWDERGVADPYVIRIDSYFYLFYLGQDRAARQRLGVARSRDGIHWQKLRGNPVLELGEPGSFDENGLGEPAVWSQAGFYWMLYTGRDLSENRRLGLARSTDGVHWTKLPAVFAGAAPWNAKVICDPEVAGGRVYFGGGDVASPDENLNGQIGSGILRPVNATLGK